MKNLRTAITRELRNRKNEWIKDLKEYTDIQSILDKWQYRDRIPTSSKNKAWSGVEELRAYLINRIEKAYEKDLSREMLRIDTVMGADDIVSIIVSIEWKKSQMWGSNPRAEAKVTYKDHTCERFDSGSIGGCGYDKTSTAVANCLNQVNGLLKRMYKVKNANITTDNRELFGYGSGSGILPGIEGGVGVSCYDKIMAKVKLSFNNTASGKSFDVYTISKRTKKDYVHA